MKLSIFLFEEVEFIVEPATTMPDTSPDTGYYFTISSSYRFDYYYFEEKDAVLDQIQFVFQQYAKPYQKAHQSISKEQSKFNDFPPEFPFLKECYGRSPMSREGMNGG